MSLRYLCRSVPPEFLRSFFLISLTIHKDILEHPWIQDPEEKTVRGGEISEADLLGESDDQGSQGDQGDLYL